MSSNSEMMDMDMSVTSLLLKTLENATREYARVCVTRCASLYGFDGDEAVKALNLENLAIQVREMKKRSTGKKTKAPKEKVVKEKVLKEKKEKVVKVVAYKPSIPLPFVASMVKEDGCHGLAYNNGLFTQCQKIRMSQSSYCKGCQSEADLSASGTPNNGTVEERQACGLMEFRDSKGRAPIAYRKMMEKQNITRDVVDQEASKLNIIIDDVHFAVVEEKKMVGKPKATKKTVTVVESAPVEDLFAQLVDEESEDETATVLIISSDSEEEADTSAQEKSERDMMKEADLESKNAEKAIKNAEKEALRIAAKEQKIANELALKEAKKMQLEQEKAQKKLDEQAAKEAKIAADLLAKEQKIAADLAAKAAKEQKLIDDKLAKEKKIADEKAAKEQKLIDDKAAKEAKIAADLLAKEQKIAADLAAKEAKKLQLEQEKAAREQKLIDDKAAKEAKIAADLLAKEQKIAADLAAKAAKEQKKAEELAAKEALQSAKKLQLEQEKAAKAEPKKQKEGTRTVVATKANFKVGDKVEYRSAKGDVSKGTVTEVKMGKSFVEYALQMEDGSCMQNAPEGNVMAAKVEAEEPAAAPKKVTVKRITIDGKQYLKTAENLLYDPDTKEEMGIYDPATNTIKELPDDSDDEVEEDGYSSE